MTTWIALFRGINVGGRNMLPMAELRSDLESLKLRDVRSYIQSGNVVFDSTSGTASSLAGKITRRVEQQHGFGPHVLVFKRGDLLEAVASNPFAGGVAHPKTLHFFFLAEPARQPDIEGIESARIASEEYKLTDRVFYLYAPDGIGRSRLAANVEKYLGVVVTARNYRTVDKLVSMVSGP